jgi:uncharacterized protein (TIGR04255 family)
MGTKMGNAPLYFTIAQVQFNPILNLDSYLPAIQAKMREMRFPDYQQEVMQELIFPFAAAGVQSVPTVANKLRFKFGSVDGWESFLVEQNRISFQSTRYDTFKIFATTIMKGLSILHEIIHLDFVERFGLRYISAVQPVSKEESLALYLTQEVSELAEKLGGNLSHSISETMLRIPAGQLLSRLVIQNAGIGLPMELAGMTVKLPERITAYTGLHAIIDNDAFFDQRIAFDLDQIQARLIALHDAIEHAFNMAITDYAKVIWA